MADNDKLDQLIRAVSAIQTDVRDMKLQLRDNIMETREISSIVHGLKIHADAQWQGFRELHKEVGEIIQKLNK
jgi:RNase H-fold protein (predicted Holliday junction resolvase)